MKTRILATIITLVFCVFNIVSQNIIPADSTHLLNNEQIKTLKSVKHKATKWKYEISLPLEVNRLLGYDVSEKQKKTKAKMLMNEAYFIDRKDCKTAICVPLVAKIDSITIESDINFILDKENNYYQTVYTTFNIPNDSVADLICLKSNWAGYLVSSIIIKNNKIVAEVDAKGEPWGIVYTPRKYNSKQMRDRGIYNAFHTADGWTLSLYESELRKKQRINNAVGIKIEK